MHTLVNSTIVFSICFQFYFLRSNFHIMVQVCFTLCPMTKAFKKRCGSLTVMVFGWLTMTVRNPKSFLLTTLTCYKTLPKNT